MYSNIKNIEYLGKKYKSCMRPLHEKTVFLIGFSHLKINYGMHELMDSSTMCKDWGQSHCKNVNSFIIKSQ